MNLFMNEMNAAMEYLHNGWSIEPRTVYASERQADAAKHKDETLALLVIPRRATDVAFLTNVNMSTAYLRLEELVSEGRASKEKMPATRYKVWHYMKKDL